MTDVAPIDQVRVLAERGANQRNTTFVGSGLRLFEHQSAADLAALSSAVPERDGHTVSPFDLGRAYELALAPAARRSKGAHLTPQAVARQVVALMPPPAPEDHVLDPAVGGAAFLLAAADQLVASGAAAHAALHQLHGVDIDEVATGVAEAALSLWALDHDLDVRALPQLRCGDGLLDDLPRVQRVVGNPPFLSQLRSSSTNTAERRARLDERWPGLRGAYTDDAWLFLAASLHAVDSQGVVAMVQPVSLLAARHGAPVREAIAERAKMTALWLAGERVFDAAVQVCALVVQRSDEGTSPPVERFVGADFAPCSSARQPAANEWGRVAATAFGVPEVDIGTPSNATVGPPDSVPRSNGGLDAGVARELGSLASATAGFRDQFYGFVPYLTECSSNVELGQPATIEAPLITVGMIDVAEIGWGKRSFRFAKRQVERPGIDLEALAKGDPTLARWTRDRLRPKVLVATQTRVVEAWVDDAGATVPATPVIAVEPTSDHPATLWKLAAVLTAPAVSAWLVASNFGTALALHALKLSARDLLAIPLPVNDEAWDQASELLRSCGPDGLRDAEARRSFAELMNDAYHIDDPSITDWWIDRSGGHT